MAELALRSRTTYLDVVSSRYGFLTFILKLENVFYNEMHTDVLAVGKGSIEHT